MQINSHTQPVKKAGANKLVLGFAAVVASAVVGTTGLVAADALHTGKPTKEQCAAAGFKNYGQCVKEWAHKQGGYHGGYNGNTTTNANTNVNLELNNSNNNVITIILNFFRS